MRIARPVFAITIAFLTLAGSMPQARGDEGMWPFNNVPRDEIKRKYGFDITDGWLHKVQLASVRFNNGGSGSFVSPDGLVMTNHHIAQETLQNISTEQKDFFKDGFYAPTHDKEVKSPGLELNVLMSIEDVTSRVNGAVAPGMSPAEANEARERTIKTISDESAKATGLRSDVIPLYQGGLYNLYRYKKYTDVRLVFAPEFRIAFFGGDPDNFEYPRYDFDLALFRVYENNQPVKVENYFKWSRDGVKDGELTFVSGNPGSTERLDTVAHLEYLRDFGFPLILNYLDMLHGVLKQYSAQGPEQERRAKEQVFGIENSLKAIRGEEAGLKEPAIMQRKEKDERGLRTSVAEDPRKQKSYGDAWDAIAKERKDLPSYEKERRCLESAWGFQSQYFGLARVLVRLATENTKPNQDRLREYTDAARQSLELRLYSPAPIYDDLEKMTLSGSLKFMRDELGENSDIVQKVLMGKSPEARASELVDGTRLKDVDNRKQIAAGGVKAIEDSTDPMIIVARAIDPESRAVRKRYEDEALGVERQNYAKIAHALFDLKGTKLYPDATFTLRLSYGPVKGYQENGKFIAPFTNFEGLYKHSAEHANRDPYEIPAGWLAKKTELNLRTPFNFVNTTDIIGGNSGSPVINTKAEIVGLIFDGNIESLVGDFVYDGRQNRAVAVDSRGMIEALRVVYNANEVVQELTR